MGRLLRAPRFPVYNAKVNGNVFEWILRKVEELRPPPGAQGVARPKGRKL